MPNTASAGEAVDSPTSGTEGKPPLTCPDVDVTSPAAAPPVNASMPPPIPPPINPVIAPLEIGCPVTIADTAPSAAPVTADPATVPIAELAAAPTAVLIADETPNDAAILGA